MIRAIHSSPLGDLTLVSNGAALCALVFEDHAKEIAAVAAASPGDDDVIVRTRRELDEFFAGARQDFDVPLAPMGPAFHARVWRQLCDLRFGETTSYAALARAAGAPRAARAVGAAVGRNPISIVIPCHRVLGASGALTGYAGGLARKRFLLAHEGARMAA